MNEESGDATATINPLESAYFPDKSALMRLPYELRCMIYIHSLKNSLKRNTRRLVQAIYYENLKHLAWADSPSPLFFLNKQISSEISDLLKREPVTMRVTGQNIKFDGLGLSICIAQGIRRDLGKISHLILSIFPPHSDRPIEMLYIWDHLRKFRDVLGQYSKIQKLSLRFRDATLFDWAEDGKLRKLLPGGYDDARLRSDLKSYFRPPESSDLQNILDLFENTTNVEKARITLPRSFRDEDSKLQTYADHVMDIMEGLAPPVTQPTCLENLDFEGLEKDFKHRTAQIAMNKLMRKTQNGKQKMSERRYDNMVRRWPYFETLVRWGDKKFMGKSHYAKVDSEIEPL